MAKIDKSLPNTPTEIDLEKEETVDATEAVTDTSMDGKTEIEMEEDGSDKELLMLADEARKVKDYKERKH